MLPILLWFSICLANLHAADSRRSQVSGTTTKRISNVQKYSFPPNNTPVSKVYVFGRPVYVRQPFVIPQRQDYRPRLDSQVFRDEKSFHGSADSLSGAVERTVVQEALVKQFFTETDPLHYQLPERPFPPKTGYSATPPVFAQKQKYPLPQCYTNDSGFMCCNSKLEQLIRDAFDDLSSDPKWQTCNVQQIANVLQNRSQSIFNTDFEALVGLGDFASKTHFFSDLICKVEVQGRFMLAYATPNRHYVRPAPYAVEPTSTIGYV